MKRIRYFDALRIVSFCFIIFYHMMVELQLQEILPVEVVTPFYANANMHIATLAVAVFFMLSGASLAYTTREKFDIKTFYKKRFVRLLIPFYITWVVWAVVKILIEGSIYSVVLPGVPKWRIIFSVLGLDAWVSMHQIGTFTQGIGEWFLGALLLLYVAFPLLRYLMKRWEKMFFIVATAIYLVVVLNYNSNLPTHINVPVHMNLIVKGYEFILGMYLGAKFLRPDKRIAWAAVPVVAYFFLGSVVLPLNNGLKITLSALAFFLAFSLLEEVLQKKKLKFMDVLSGCSYELFLVHHVIIQALTPVFKPYIQDASMVVVLFAVEILVMIPCTILLKKVSDKCVKLVMNSKIARSI